jgi:hypothetical protein
MQPCYPNEGTFEITDPQGLSEFNIGDEYNFAFTYDDQAADTEPSTGGGRFNTAITAFTLSAVPGNTPGSWDPSGSTFTLPGSIQTRAAGPDCRLQPQGTGLPPSVASHFCPWISCLLGGFTVTDTGSGQTLAAQIGGDLPGDLGTFSRTGVGIANAGEGGPSGTITAFNVVLVPPAVWLFGSGLLGLIGVARRRNQIH